jgi:hypothetical protein
VLQFDGRWKCVACGALLDVPDGAPYVIVKAASGTPTMRTVNIGGTEIHRCPIAGSPDANIEQTARATALKRTG